MITFVKLTITVTSKKLILVAGKYFCVLSNTLQPPGSVGS